MGFGKSKNDAASVPALRSVVTVIAVTAEYSSTSRSTSAVPAVSAPAHASSISATGGSASSSEKPGSSVPAAAHATPMYARPQRLLKNISCDTSTPF